MDVGDGFAAGVAKVGCWIWLSLYRTSSFGYVWLYGMLAVGFLAMLSLWRNGCMFSRFDREIGNRSLWLVSSG